MRSLYFTSFILISIVIGVQQSMALRCRTEEGINEEDMKRIVRTCMKHVGHRVSDTNSNNSSSNSDSAEYSDENDDDYNQKNKQHNQNQHQNWGNRRRYDYRRFHNIQGTAMHFNNQPAWGNDNSNNNRHGQSLKNRGQYEPNYMSNSTEQDRNCLMHCFFHEMKMTNNNDYPDKHRSINILAKDIRDRELRDFYTDSVQQCFHMVEMMDNHHKKKDKCVFTQSIVTCLIERAKANCDDFGEEVMMF